MAAGEPLLATEHVEAHYQIDPAMFQPRADFLLRVHGMSMKNIGILDGVIVAEQDDYTYNSPRWDLWGTALVFQQFKLHGAFKPEIGVWKPGFTEPIILTLINLHI